MKSKVITSMVFILAAMMLAQVALASTCNFSFESNGVTYYGIHHVDNEGSWVEVINPLRDTSSSFDFDNPSDEYVAYESALDAASAKHVAQCPYMHDLGDDRVPLALLCGAATLTAIATIIVHKKRLSVR